MKGDGLNLSRPTGVSFLLNSTVNIKTLGAFVYALQTKVDCEIENLPGSKILVVTPLTQEELLQSLGFKRERLIKKGIIILS
jgi:hypothetical protein